MRQNLHHLVRIKSPFAGRERARNRDRIASRLLARHRPGELRIRAMTGLDRDDMTANAMTDEREVTNDIEDFVPNEFIRETKRLFA